MAKDEAQELLDCCVLKLNKASGGPNAAIKELQDSIIAGTEHGL